jgi:hypothetical protein
MTAVGPFVLGIPQSGLREPQAALSLSKGAILNPAILNPQWH